MHGLDSLKEEIKITPKKVECPVKECSNEVDRKYRKDTHKDTAEFRCPLHKIVISPSTFVYPNETDNLLWKDPSDLELLEKIKAPKIKRESRFAHDNSEDAVSWNVFRFLEKNNLIEGLLDAITDTSHKTSEVIYWSYSQGDSACWPRLEEARREFGETKSQGSEPDIIIQTDRALFFIEAKLDTPTKKIPSKKDPSYISRRLKKYLTGGENWFFKVSHSEFGKVVNEGLYELLRFWILGTWIAEQQDLDFYLINLVLAEREADIEALFKRHILKNQRKTFLRVTWETIFRYISEIGHTRDKEIVMRYFENKTLGYRNGKVRKAFSTH